MLYALAHPLSLIVLASSYVLGVTVHGWVQSLVAARLGDRVPQHEGRTRPDPRRHVDPFGAVAALISGLGWARPVELRRGPEQRWPQLAVGLSGPLTNLALGMGALLAWRGLYGPAGTVSGAGQIGPAYVLQHGGSLEGAVLSSALLLFGYSQLYLGALSLLPLPPLDGGRLLFALGPRSLGWQKAEHQLVARNIGVVVLLALLIVPLGGPQPILPRLLDIVLTPLVVAVIGG